MELRDIEILERGESLISPFSADRVQPASYDLSLHDELLVPTPYRTIDLRRDRPGDHMRKIRIDGSGFELPPRGAVLGCVSESLRIPADMKARAEGKSTIGRVFLAVHVTAGFIDSGWEGRITLEIVNMGPWSIVLWPGMPIAQVNFTMMPGPCRRPYGSNGLGSHYHGDQTTAAAVGEREVDGGDRGV
jgi:dCTP deaminase